MENENGNQPTNLVISLGFCIGILKNMGINLTAKDIKMPSAENLNVIYKAFLSECLSIQQDAYEKDNLVDAVLNFPEDIVKAQSESFKIMQFYIIIKYFFELCGLNPSFMEIFCPLKGKFLRLLSGMISFCRFEFQELGDDFAQIVQDSKTYMRRCVEEKKGIEELSGKIYYINSDNMKNKSLVDQCKKRTSALKEKDQNMTEEIKRMEQLEEAAEREEAALETEDKDIVERQQTIKKKFILYDKLIIKSPGRLNKELDKNEARIIELKKFEKLRKAEIEEETRNLFERETFIESQKSIKEMLENHFLINVQSANTKKKEIDTMKEEITNLDFIYQQSNSSIESLTKNYEKLLQSIDNHSKEFENKLIQYKDFKEQISQQKTNTMSKIKVLEEEKGVYCKKINDIKIHANEIINNAISKIEMFHKNEEFCNSIGAAKMKTLGSLEEAGHHRVEQALSKMKKSFEMFVKHDKEARSIC